MQSHSPELIRYVHGRPVLLHEGEPVSQAAYCDYIIKDDWEDRIREFADNGVRVFYVRLHQEEDKELWGIPPAERLQDWGAARLRLADQVEYILSVRPDAQFVIRPNCTPPAEWLTKYPEEVQTDEDGHTYPDACPASERYLADMVVFLQRLVRHCESQPWGERVLGYLEASYGEGCTMLTISGKMFDCAPPSEAGFRAWVQTSYATDAELQAAWGDPAVNRATASVPRDRDWLEKRAHGTPTIKGEPQGMFSLPSGRNLEAPGLFHWIEPAQAAREHDYCRFLREVFTHKYRLAARTLKETCAEFGRERWVGFDITKQPLMGWQILSAFDGLGDGQSFGNLLLLSGSYDTAELLDDPHIDLIFTPADYHARTLGFAYEAEGVTDSMLLRGKTMIIENDARNYVGEGIIDQGAFRDDREVEAGLTRNAALTLSRGIQSYWCNVGSSYFHAPGIQRTIAKLTPLLDRLNEYPHRETRDALAFVIDDESLFTEDFTSGYQTLAVIWQRILGLAHCGVPYRIYLFSDLTKDIPNYHTWLFPDLFVVNEERLALLREKVLRDGNLAIFGPASGISDGRYLGAEGASALLGVPMELIPRTTPRHVIVQDYGHPISRELPASFTYGDSLPYGPTLMPGDRAVENGGGVPLGHASASWFINRTGLFLKEFGAGAAGNGRSGARGADDYGVLWSCALPLPSNLLRAAARYAGSHIWCEEDDVIYASDSLAALHSVKAGPRTLRLPRACTVHDALTQEKLGEGLTEIRLEINPPQTRIFTLE
ncbi:MAG TPA: hypothetical protein VGM19_02880 [Armatimonadota bacterium]